MIPRFSVTRPFYILAAVIVVLLIGAFSLSYMKTDLYPAVEIPYLAVITPDPGASPEKVETEVTDILEEQLATVSGVDAVQTASYENASVIVLEFVEDTDMDSALVKVSAAINTVSEMLPDSAGTPSYLELSLDSMAMMYLGVSLEGKTVSDTSQFVTETLQPVLERQEGVASVTATGLISDTVDVVLDQSKIDEVNNRLLASVNSKLGDSKAELDNAQAQLDAARNQLDEQDAALNSQQGVTERELSAASKTLNQLLSSQSSYEAQLTVEQAKRSALEAQLVSLGHMPLLPGVEEQIAKVHEQIAEVDGTIATIQMVLNGFNRQAGEALDSYEQVESSKMEVASSISMAKSQVAMARSQLDANQQELNEGYASYESARDQAIENANINGLLDINTLASLIQAQNFSMPAGYIKDAQGTSWLLKVGEEFGSVEELAGAVLVNIEGIGDVHLSDVATIEVISDSGVNYAKLNGQDGVILSVTKSSTGVTSEVSDRVNEALAELEEANPDLRIMKLTDQGDYIDLYITTILTGLISGAILAVVVLALFLRAVRPTLVIAFSIPFSVLFALVIMYFANLSLNVMTLGALSLAIGMLVDNSVVVLENIYRLRGRGIEAPRAAAQGANQVLGAIVSSTLTTICVFLPFVFTSGIERQLMVPFALTISFALIASLIVALTVVPALGAKLFSHSEPKNHQWFEKLKLLYGRGLELCLHHKAPVLIVAVVLLGICTVAVFRMGIVLVPDMTSDEISAVATMPDEMSEQEAYGIVDTLTSRIKEIPGVADVGAADMAAMGSVMGSVASSMASSEDSYTGSFMVLVTIDSHSVFTEDEVKTILREVSAAGEGLDCEFFVGLSQMTSSLTDVQMAIDIKGEDTSELMDLSDEVMAVVASIPGYENVENGQEEAEETLQLVFDKNKVASLGTTVAQIYQQIVPKLDSSTSAMSLDLADETLSVDLISERHQITVENLLDTTFELSSGHASATGSASAGFAATGSAGAGFAATGAASTGLAATGSVEETPSESAQVHSLREVARVITQPGLQALTKLDGTPYIEVTADIASGYNSILLARELEPALDEIARPEGYTIEIVGTDADIYEMIEQMIQLLILGAVLIYLIMMAQFQSFRAPFIIILTVPLAFTGGLLALLIAGEQLSMMSLLGFVILMGTVVNNGIVFVDYANRLRRAGMEKRAALIATGMTRMRPILMTALTTILAMCALIFNPAIGSSVERGMALVVAGGLLYATFMTLFVVPIVYDLIWRKPMKVVDLGEDLNDDPGDAEAFIAALGDRAKGGLYKEKEQLRFEEEVQSMADALMPPPSHRDDSS